jgi:hypothetical protein
VVNLFAKTVGMISSYILNSKTEFDYLIIGQKASVLDVSEGAPLRVCGGFSVVLADGVALKVCGARVWV